MGFLDKAKDLAGKAKDKTDALVEKNRGKLPPKVERTYDKVSKTTEKHVPGETSSSPTTSTSSTTSPTTTPPTTTPPTSTSTGPATTPAPDPTPANEPTSQPSTGNTPPTPEP